MADFEDFEDDEVRIPISSLGKKNGMSKTELTRIICNPFNPKKGIKLRRALRGGNKIRYFLGKRLYECFVTKNGETVDVKNSKQIKDYGQWLLNEKYIVPNKVVDKKTKEIARNKTPNPIFSADGFYTWTQYAFNLVGAAEDAGDDGDVANVNFSTEIKNRSKKKKKNQKEENEETNSKIEKKLGLDKSNKNKQEVSGGVGWLHIAILLMILAPSLFAIVGYLIPAETPRQKLINFYLKYAPEKNNEQHINKLLDKYKNKENLLFAKLERKYETIRIQEEARKRDEP